MNGARHPGRPREVELDERILDATLHLLAEKGYARMSMQDIAIEANTTRAAIYLRYSSKAELATEAIVRARRTFTLPPLTGDLRSDLVAQLRHFQESMAAPYSLPLVGTVLAEVRATPELLVVFRQHVTASRREMIRSILWAAQSRSELAPQVDIDLVIAQLIGSYYAIAIAGDPLPPDWPERIVNQVFTGILRDPSSYHEP